MLNWDDVLVRADSVITEETEGEMVVVLPEQGKYVVLNASGAQILALVDGEVTLADLASRLAAKFAVDPERVRGDVLRFVQDMISRGILQVVD